VLNGYLSKLLCMFCEKCGKLLKNKGGSFVCTACGFEKSITDESMMHHVDKRKEKEIVIVEDTEAMRTLPTIDCKCPKCGNGEAFWWLRQLRAADESEVRFFRCTKCGKTWREYD
jgi:DNA-directed RNA polymerase subunit M